MATMVHHHHLPSQPSTSTSHPHGHGHGHGQHQHQHQHHHHSASTASYSYSPSDFDLLKALTSGSAGKNTAKKALKQQQSSSLRRPALDPLILETAASSGPHVTRNHFLHEFYPHPEDPSSAFSWHASHYPAQSQNGLQRSTAYASCDLGPEDDIRATSSSSAHIQGALEQEELPTASTSTSTLNNARLDPNKTKLPRAVEDDDSVEADDESALEHAMYRSRQAPRKVRLERERSEKQELESQQQHNEAEPNDTEDRLDEAGGDGAIHPNLKDVDPSEKLQHSLSTPDSHASIFHPDPVRLPQLLKISQPSFFHPFPISSSISQPPTSIPLTSLPPESRPPLQVVCYARTRVPTPHGEVFLHIYKNNWDDKEHLAFVFDKDQLNDNSSRSGTEIDANGKVNKEQTYGSLRSKSLDSVWRKGETDVERIVRGAYVGRLSPTSAQVSRPADEGSDSSAPPTSSVNEEEAANTDDAVLVRIHSECFTGETIGSQRCDCGEQLDEAFRLIGTSSSGLGIIIYLRQEGRGIGLLEKIKAYNLQDLGHDTVTANLLLGHGADQRNYALAGEMLRDLGVGNTDVYGKSRNVRLMTNNPDKIDSIEKEGIKVEERVPMVPRGWTVSMPHITIQKKHKKSSKKNTKSRNASTGNTGSSTISKKKRRPKLNLQDSVASIRSTATQASPPLLSPALSSTMGGFKARNKTIEALKPLSSSSAMGGYDVDGIRSIEASASEAETEDNDIDDAADSYEMPSVPGSADERDSLEGHQPYSNSEEEEEDNDDEDEEEEEDSEDSAEREEALEDYLISMNRTGVGMIGAGVTHSKELEKYLKTKIERMGHMLVAPATPPSTPLPLQRNSRIRKHQSQDNKRSSTHTTSKLADSSSLSTRGKHQDVMMEGSTASLAKTDEESIKCDVGNECEDCQRQKENELDLHRFNRGYFDSEIHGEDMFG